MKITCQNLEETMALAAKIAPQLKGGDILALSGDLGSGKTSFTKGLAKKIGIKDEIKSPTFTLMNVYKTHNNSIKRFVHIDTYRLENENQLIEIGAEDYLGDKNTVSIIEWPEKITELLKNKKVTEIKFRHTENNCREIEITDLD
jgi:tRNA threonylcarbamoyladenosine biosynthesis protein TsaE